MKNIVFILSLLIFVSCSKSNNQYEDQKPGKTNLSSVRSANIEIINKVETMQAANIAIYVARIELDLKKIELEKAKLAYDLELVEKLRNEVKLLQEKLNEAIKERTELKNELKERGVPTCWGR